MAMQPLDLRFSLVVGAALFGKDQHVPKTLADLTMYEKNCDGDLQTTAYMCCLQQCWPGRFQAFCAVASHHEKMQSVMNPQTAYKELTGHDFPPMNIVKTEDGLVAKKAAQRANHPLKSDVVDVETAASSSAALELLNDEGGDSGNEKEVSYDDLRKQLKQAQEELAVRDKAAARRREKAPEVKAEPAAKEVTIAEAIAESADPVADVSSIMTYLRPLSSPERVKGDLGVCFSALVPGTPASKLAGVISAKYSQLQSNMTSRNGEPKNSKDGEERCHTAMASLTKDLLECTILSAAAGDAEEKSQQKKKAATREKLESKHIDMTVIRVAGTCIFANTEFTCKQVHKEPMFESDGETTTGIAKGVILDLARKLILDCNMTGPMGTKMTEWQVEDMVQRADLAGVDSAMCAGDGAPEGLEDIEITVNTAAAAACLVDWDPTCKSSASGSRSSSSSNRNGGGSSSSGGSSSRGGGQRSRGSSSRSGSSGSGGGGGSSSSEEPGARQLTFCIAIRDRYVGAGSSGTGWLHATNTKLESLMTKAKKDGKDELLKDARKFRCALMEAVTRARSYCCKASGHKYERQAQRGLNAAGVRFQKEAAARSAARRAARTEADDGSPTKRARTEGGAGGSMEDTTKAMLFR
jgi:hypothetical protein